MKRFTKFRHFMPGSPLWREHQAKLAKEAEEAESLLSKAKKIVSGKKKSSKKSSKK